MAVDKNLFLYNLAVVAIMKNEAPYVKEWIDYHLAAGVDHFYIYDNESPDNLKEVLQPYIDAGIVTYTFYPGTGRQIEAYMEAFRAHRFFCRYMAFIDADEFIFPQENKSIVEVADEIFNAEENLGGIQINWMMYGSNNLETADYSRGVLERFTRRAEKIFPSVKTIANPRKIDYLTTPHYMFYFDGTSEIISNIAKGQKGIPDKILINHYRLKSREEFLRKNTDFKGDVAYSQKDYYNEKRFTHEEDNDVFDDSILIYYENRMEWGGTVKPLDYERLTSALIKNLSPVFSKNATADVFAGKLETFLTCRALASYFKENVLDKKRGEMLESTAVKAVVAAIHTEISVADAELFISELPNILKLNYPEVKDILSVALEIITQIKKTINSKIDCPEKFQFWRNFNDYDKIFRILQAFKYYKNV